jgi:hypothetical protein
MKRLFSASLAAVSCLAQAQSTIPPLPATTVVVNAMAALAGRPREGFTRLRLGLTSNEPSANQVVRLAGVALCSTSVCYESAVPGSVKMSSTADGTSTTIADLEMPYSEIDTVRFKSVAGPGVLHGSIALPQALKLEPGFKGFDIMVVVQKRPDGAAGAAYEPIAAAANYLQPEGTSIYYNPKFATTVKLPFGSSIAIPAGALHSPRIFIAAVHDTGDEFPLLDIYPVVRLAKAATVRISTIERAPKALISGQPPPTPAPKAASPGGSMPSQVQTLRAPTTSSFEIFSTGVIRRSP